ncbi:MAG: hypothetical protein SF123_15240 [Chloroflexota bacterium]|nr:hypothetical protein [Chloroflexota bacterium]
MNLRKSLIRAWYILPIAVLLLVFSSVTTTVTIAQLGGTCAALVEDALAAVGNNCGGLGRNSACYGFDNVSATFNEVMPSAFFTRPADLVELVDLQTLITGPLEIESSRWGIAVLSVQADLPDALPGQNVTFLLFGDVSLENAVDPSVAGAQGEALEVTTSADVTLFTRPVANANTSATVPAATLLSADRLSDDLLWVRVVYEDIVGWLRVEDVTSAADITALPTLSTAPAGTMQAVRLTTSPIGVNCDAAPPSLLVVQGPQRMTVNLNVNGAELNIGSTIALWTATEGDNTTMQLAVIDGGVYLDDGTYIPAGYIAQVTLDESGNVTGVWTEPRPMTLEEWLLFEPLENVPLSVLQYEIDVPSELIANLSPTDVPQDNNPPPNPNNPPANPPVVTAVDCAGLRPTSPLDGLPYGGVTFFWDSVGSGSVTGYRVNVYRDGALAVSFATGAGQTNVSGDLSGIPLFGSYTWEVQALVNGVVVCNAPTNVSFARSFPADNPPANPPAPIVTVVPAPVCGNFVCESPTENSSTCPIDCPVTTPEPVPPFCGNEVCEPGEDSETCYIDCFVSEEPFCGNEVCEPGEDSETCYIDCFVFEEPFCGNEVCEPGEEATCTADCFGGVN